MVETTEQLKNEAEVQNPETPQPEDIKQLFIDLQEGIPTEEIVSLCMNCQEEGNETEEGEPINGVTKFMMTKIPMFKEIILSSFYCEHCHDKNTEVQFGGKLAGQGVKYTFNLTDASHLNRSIVKSEFATIRIPELEFEIPPQTQKGSINTPEGFFANSIEGIGHMQAERRKFDPATAAKIDEFLVKLTAFKEGEVLPFTFEINDPSGNSFVQNNMAPQLDPALKVEYYDRSYNDYATMGYNGEEALADQEEEQKKFKAAKDKELKESMAVKQPTD